MKSKYLITGQRQEGQVVIETALMMILLLVLFFGIAEIARTWWLKNQLNNAARVGVRVAIVTPGLTTVTNSPCNWSNGCTAASANDAVQKTCASITTQSLCEGVPAGTNPTRVTIAYTDNDLSGGINTGDSIKVSASGTFHSVVPNLSALSFGLFQNPITMTTSATMRYE